VYGQTLAKLQMFIKEFEEQGLPPEAIAKLLLNILQKKHPKVRYAPVPNKLINWFIPNLLPSRLVDWILAKKLHLIKNKN